MKQLLQAKRVSEAIINFVMGTKIGIDTLKDFLARFSKDRYEQEIKYVIDATLWTRWKDSNLVQNRAVLRLVYVTLGRLRDCLCTPQRPAPVQPLLA